MIGRRLAVGRRPSTQVRSVDACEFCDLPFHLLAPKEVLDRILNRDPDSAFVYVVTPNADHVVRVQRSESAGRLPYDEAWLSLCDSAVLSKLARLVGTQLPVVAGSDLVAAIFAHLERSDRIVVIGCDEHDVEALRRRYRITHIAHYNPPMGFIDIPGEVQACVDFAVAHPARFTFLAVGSPQQEIVANHLYHCGQATGLGLCIGSALRLLSGAERRAPAIVRGSGFEWLFRLAQDPPRLWRRYLVRSPLIFWLALRYAFASAPASGRGLVRRSLWPPDRR